MENNQEKKVGDKDKDETEESPSSSVDDIQHLLPSSSTSTMENNQEKKVEDKDEDGPSNILTSETEEEKKKGDEDETLASSSVDNSDNAVPLPTALTLDVKDESNKPHEEEASPSLSAGDGIIKNDMKILMNEKNDSLSTKGDMD
eukprot:3149696-Ditylum_brightwellii.AAC.1